MSMRTCVRRLAPIAALLACLAGRGGTAGAQDRPPEAPAAAEPRAPDATEAARDTDPTENDPDGGVGPGAAGAEESASGGAEASAHGPPAEDLAERAAADSREVEPAAAVAETATEAAGEATSPASAPLRGPGDRRAVPDYDGLPDPGPTAEEVLIWIPRILLMPIYVLTEFVIRRPLGELLTVAEREGWVTTLVDFFTWDGLRAGLVPVAFYDFGLLPSVGLYLFWNDVGAPGHQFRAHVSFGGIDWLRGTIRDRVLLDRNIELSFRVDAYRWPDRIFQGLGAGSRVTDAARYRQNQLGGGADITFTYWRRSAIRLGLGVTWNDFSPDGYEPSHTAPSLATALGHAPVGTLNALPPGFDGFAAYVQHVRFTLDSREDSPAPQHGVRLDLNAEQGLDLLRPVARSWLRYGASLSGYVDAGMERVFSLHLVTSFADPLGTDDVPFTEMARLGGGVLLLPAFLPGVLVGRSAVALTLRYRWPIWVHLDASLFVGTGNVFGEHLRDFDAEMLRLSWGLSLQTLNDRDYAFRITFALGTRQFAYGGDVESVRFSIGGSLGF